MFIEKNKKTLSIIFVVILLLIGYKIKILNEEVDYLSGLVDEANNSIEEANSVIEEAQDYAWSSYEDMGYALDSMYTVDTIY